MFKELRTGFRIRFDKAQNGKQGFAGISHYHIDNPDAKDKKIGRYLNKNGNPVNKNSKESHIIPGGSSYDSI